MSSNFKGIVLAGGSGTRLHPVTKGVSKHLLSVYDKPMIYYPLSVLMLAGIKDILLISTPEDISSYERLLGSGKEFGINLNYAVQDKPDGLAQAFIIGEKFIGNDNVALVLGDNIFYGQYFSSILSHAVSQKKGATIFGYQVKDPQRFGVVEFDANMKVKSIEEKPLSPKSDYAITGLYFYDNEVINVAKKIKPSERGELEITDVNRIYLNKKNLHVEILGRGFAWLDTGTHESLLRASQFISTIEINQGLKVACLEEIAYKNNWITKDAILSKAKLLEKTNYGAYLKNIAKENDN